MTTPSSSWRNDILEALQERDEREKANIYLINEYTKLADRATKLQNANNHNIISGSNTLNTITIAPHPAPHNQPTTTGTGSSTTSLDQLTAATSAQHLYSLQQELLAAQTARTKAAVALKATTKELQKLTDETHVLEKVRAEVEALELKLGDKEDEKRVKGKVVENLQDEILALNIHLNLMNEAKQKLRRENDELIKRWKAMIGEEQRPAASMMF